MLPLFGELEELTEGVAIGTDSVGAGLELSALDVV